MVPFFIQTTMQLTQQLERMVRLVMIPKEGITIAIYMHLIPRHDKKPRKELTHPRYKNGTKLFERYMTVQCVDASFLCRMIVSDSVFWSDEQS